tara:strand:+ start:369 stop:818 length:450 start_codon:yes stop_codon:yes gene_type:complete
LNSLLSLNKRSILILALIALTLFISIFSFQFYKTLKLSNYQDNENISDVDITDPRFSINGDNQKILVSAKEGNFIDNNKILLQREVKFKSNNFSIETDKVIFDRKEQTAESKSISQFNSEKTEISSEGFNIYDNGNRISFKGNSIIILK